MRLSRLRPIFAAVALVATACGGGSQPSQPASSAAPGPAATAAAVAADKSAYPVFPNADAGADPAVPADQGGKGFTGDGWETNKDFDLIGDPHAVKGGVFREAIRDFPATLRYIGPNLSTWNSMLSGMVYESLLGLDPVTLDYMPVLATHWQVGPDKQTLRFRIDPNARFNDGTPVTSDDVVASWKLLVDKTVQDPFRNAQYDKFEEPVAESKYIARVKAKDASWMSLYVFSGMSIYPAHVLKGLTGATFLKEYNDKMLPGTGPYFVTPADVEKGKAVHIRRRKDYWADKYRRNVGLSNFDEVREIVVRDRNLEFEMLKKGDLDFYYVQRAQMWAEELDFDKIQSGLLQKRKVWNHNPKSLQGIAFNTRRKPYDDIRVRKALRLLFNRELMIEKLMYNEYQLMDSVFPNSIYENKTAEKIRYNPQQALQLLAEAGWKDRNAQGQLVKNGTPLTLELLYYDSGSEKYLTIFQEDMRKVGINLSLRYVTPETGFKLLDDQQFDMFSVAYGGGGPFPLPSQFYDSKLADQKATTNVTGFKNARVDEILKVYETEFDLSKRVQLLQELDAIVLASQNYLLEWTAPFERMVYWNKFGQPRGIITRTGDYRDPPTLWWLDPQKNQQLEAALRDPSKKLEVGASDDRYWLDFARTEERQIPRGYARRQMTSYFVRRLLLMIPTFIGITVVSFVVMHFVPGGPIERQIMLYKMAVAQEGGGGSMGQFGTEISPEAVEEMKKFYGFDKPLPIRYLRWLWNVVHLDLGNSYVYQDPVWDVIKSRFPVSIFLGLTGFFVSYLVCIPLGVMKAVWHGSRFDFTSSALVFLGYAFPGWALGTALLVLLGGGSFWNVFPLGGFRPDNWEYLSLWGKVTGQAYHMFLPVLCYVLGSFATETILTKNSIMENLGQDYVRTAFAKGLPERRVIFVHVLRNSLIPLVTGFGHVISLILAGSFLIERVFNIDGMGYLGYNAILQRDYPVALGILVISSGLMLVGNILSDVIYAIVDPRIRFQ